MFLSKTVDVFLGYGFLYTRYLLSVNSKYFVIVVCSVSSHFNAVNGFKSHFENTTCLVYKKRTVGR